MTSTTLVTGGTGTLGRLVAPSLRDAGHDVRVLSRNVHEYGDLEVVTGDLADGTGIDDAMKGVSTVVHLAGSAKGDDVKAHHLARAAAGAGVDHIVMISVVGAGLVPTERALDRAMFGYFGAKHAAEEIVAGSGVPWTTLRATQFHELLLDTVAQMVRMPVVPVPSGFRFQPVAAAEVADRLVELAGGPAEGLVASIGGPEVHTMDELIRSYLRASGRRRPLLPVRIPGRAAGAFRAGANLAPGGDVGRRTWDQHLANRMAELYPSAVAALP
jgi:uncharacterized protein YbjT (DUF2867 family)